MLRVHDQIMLLMEESLIRWQNLAVTIAETIRQSKISSGQIIPNIGIGHVDAYTTVIASIAPIDSKPTLGWTVDELVLSTDVRWIEVPNYESCQSINIMSQTCILLTRYKLSNYSNKKRSLLHSPY